MSLSMSLTGFYVRGTLTVKGLSSIKKDSVVTTRDSSKDCILACKISNQMHTNFEKRKVPPAVSGDFAQKFCKTCKTYVMYNICSFICAQMLLKNTFEVGHT